MKYLLAWMTLILSTAYAAEAEALILELELRINGTVVSQPRVVSLSGETASIETVSEEGDGVFIEVTPTLRENDQVHMGFVIARVEDTKKIILSEPQLVSLLGQPAEITEGRRGSPTVSLAVTATRKTH